MNSFNDDEDFLSELTRLNKFDEPDQIDFEALMESFDDITTNPLFSLSNQTNELESEIDYKLSSPQFQKTIDNHERIVNKSQFEDSLSNSIDDSDSLQSSTSFKKTNKQAALRYRLKKVNEKDKLFEAKDYLEKQNDNIKREIDHVKTEIDHLKTLIVQILMLKGIMSPTGKIINT